MTQIDTVALNVKPMNQRSILTQEQTLLSRQKRWTSEESIVSEIDRQRNLQRSRCCQAELLSAEADCFLRLSRDESIKDEERYSYLAQFKESKGRSDALFSKADRQESRIKSFSLKLSAFRTGLLASVTLDPGVV